MNYNNEIQRALTLQFNTLLSAYKIQWPNSKFTTPNAETWLKFNLMTGEVFGQTLTETDRVNGIIQIDVMMQKLKGEKDAFTIADILTTNLPKNNTPIINGATSVFIKNISPPRTSADDSWHRKIIEISFYAFVPR